MFTEVYPHRVKKTFIVEEEISQVTRVFNADVDITEDGVSLEGLYDSFLGDRNKRVKVYNFATDKYCLIERQSLSIPVSFLGNGQSQILLFKFSDAFGISVAPNSSISEDRPSGTKSEASCQKKERSKERIIFEVIEIIRKWREIHLGKDHFKKISLQQAAKMVGLPKKSLDDYYYQLRLGEKHGFDFHLHLNQRVGVLRSFLKNIKDSGSILKTEKHPKKLKIIENFAELQEQYRNTLENFSPEGHESMEEEERQGVELSQADNQLIQNEFYNEFEFVLDEPDPFFSFDHNFRKKGNEYSQEQFY